jgi:putative hemolysin
MKVERKKELTRVKIEHNRVLFWIIIVLFVLLIAVVVSLIRIKNLDSDLLNGANGTGLANPATVYCQKSGNWSIKEDSLGNQYGVCTFANNVECEEWAYYIGECNKSSSLGKIECFKDSDCVASTCCHATSCVARAVAPNCSSRYCTLDCKPNTLDCGQASCLCVNNKCSTSLK